MALVESTPFTSPRNIHMIGLAGVAMSGIATALRRTGWRVTGSDNRVYGRGAEVLHEAGLTCLSPCAAENLPADTDLVLVGATHGIDNPELVEARARGLPVATFPEFLSQWFGADARVLLVAGTNGKTSTTAMLIHALHQAGERPSYLLGGQLPGLEDSVSLANPDMAVLEADESRCAAWLPEPKFLQLPVTSLVLTSLAFDHPETFADEAAYIEAFRTLLRRLPAHGFVVAHEEDWSKLQPATTQARAVTLGAFHSSHRLEVADDGTYLLDGVAHASAAPGRHQARNAALACVALRHWLGRDLTAACWQSFPGVRGRCQQLCLEPIPVYWDIGYHPEAIRSTVASLRSRHPARRIRLILRPRLLGEPGSWIETQLPTALTEADWVDSFPEEQPRGSPDLKPDEWRIQPILQAVRDQGREARFCPTIRSLRESLAATLAPDMVLLFALAEQHHAIWEGIVPELRNWLQTQPSP
jgi:UDP-N-acetylmuramate: L-alanyl-gamma-D-glutamyl-meso-diaminopimelate ligase